MYLKRDIYRNIKSQKSGVVKIRDCEQKQSSNTPMIFSKLDRVAKLPKILT
jgi:hypothetical protein